MKKFAFVPLAALAFTAACDQDPTAIVPEETALVSASAPGTPVTGTFTITNAGGTTVTPRATPHPIQSGGSCSTNEDGVGVWTKTTNGTTHSHVGHEHCNDVTETAGSTVIVTFTDQANYVQPKSGNLALNLVKICEQVLNETTGEYEEICPSRFVHFQKNQNWTSGAGIVTGSGSDGSTWTIDLSQIAHADNFRAHAAAGQVAAYNDGISPLYRTYTKLLAKKVGSIQTFGRASFSW